MKALLLSKLLVYGTLLNCYFSMFNQVLIKKGRKSRAHAVLKASGLKVLTRGVARTNFRCVAKQAMIVPKIKKHVLNMLKRDIQSDIKHMCSVTTGSILQESSVDAAGKFSWTMLQTEVKHSAPTLFAVLEACVDVKRRKNPVKQRKTKKRTSSNVTIFGICAAIILRHRNHHMNLLQRMVSLALHSGHSSKQVNIH